MDADLFKNKYRIQSARHKYHDYSDYGAYFVTICCENMHSYFGEMINYQIQLSRIGQIVNEFWYEIPNRFPNVMLDKFIIMPNHLHGIIIIVDKQRRDAINRVSTNQYLQQNGGITKNHNPMGKKSLGEIVRWYKGRCSFEINKFTPNFAWQPRYYDRIIRNERTLNKIREYIQNNPYNWNKK